MLIREPYILSLFFAFGLAWFVYGIEEIIFSGPQRKYLRGAKGFLKISSTLISFTLTVLFFYGALSSPCWLKVVYLGFFIFVSMVEYGYQKVMRRFAVAGDVEIGLISPPVMWKDAGSLYFDARVFIAILIVVGMLSTIHPVSSWEASLAAFGILFMIIIPLNNIQHKLAYRLNWGPSLIQAIATLVDFGRMRFTRAQRERLTFQSTIKPANNIVLIMDESLRADHLSVNGYLRPTCPYLEELAKEKDLFHN